MAVFAECSICQGTQGGPPLINISHAPLANETEERRAVRNLECVFHERCIRPWMQSCNARNTPSTCPNCRGRITHVNGEELAARPRDAAAADEAEPAVVPVADLLGDVDVDGTVEHAIRNGHLQLVQLVSAAFSDFLNPARFDHYLLTAADEGTEDVAEELLASGHITEDGVHQALIIATTQGHTNVVQVLLQNEAVPVTQEMREEALDHAHEWSTFLALVENGPVSEEHARAGFQRGMDAGWFRNDLSRTRARAAGLAGRLGYWEISEFLMHNHDGGTAEFGEFLANRRNINNISHPLLWAALTAGVLAIGLITNFFWNRSENL